MRFHYKVVFLILCCIAFCFGKVVFSVRPAPFSFNGTLLGFGENRLVPFVGLFYGYASLKDEYEWEDEVWDPDIGDYVTTLETSELKFFAHLIVPTVGTRLYIKKGEKIAPYLTGSFFYIIPIFDFKEDGEDILSDGEKKDIKAAITALGLSAGVGVEFFFTNEFSISGEFCYNLMVDRARMEELMDSKLFGALGLTQSIISLNFYL